MPTGYKLPSSGVLSGIDLANWAKLKKNDTGGDQFHKGFDDGPIAGRQFRVRYGISGAGFGEPGFIFDKDSSTLTLQVEMRSGASSRGSMVVLEKSQKIGEPKIMSNAFGATADVIPITETLIGMGAYESSPGLFRTEVGDMGPYNTYRQLDYKLKLSGDDAEKLTSNMYAVIEGAVAKNKEGHTVECDYGKQEAKLDDKFERETQSCIVVVKFKRISFISAGGKVQKSWVAGSGKTSAAPRTALPLAEEGDE